MQNSFDRVRSRSCMISNPAEKVGSETEKADLVAARRVRDAIKADDENRTWDSVEAALVDLYTERRVDDQTMRHVFSNIHRFVICPPPVYFDVTWHIES